MKTVFQSILCALAVQAEAHAVVPNPSREAVLRGLAEAPLYFEAAAGPAGGRAVFTAMGGDCAVQIFPTEAVLALTQVGGARAVRLTLHGANPNAEIGGMDEQPARASHFIGADAASWRTGLPLFARVRVREVYEGIDAVYYANAAGRLEYDFLVRPGADPGRIALRLDGADAIRLDASGDLILGVGGDEVREHKPEIYQTVNGVRRTIAGGYRLAGQTAGFWVGDYDRALPLVIDPTIAISFSSYVAGKYGDRGWGIAVDTNGNVYVCGDTLTPSLLSKKTAQFQTQYGGSQGTMQYGDAFVAKFVPDSSNVLSLAYLTYLGGLGQDAARAIAADGEGNAYVTGFTDSPNFPTAPANAIFRRISGRNNTALGFYRSDAFVSKLGPQGTNLIYSTYLGGAEIDSGNAIAVDASGSAYVAGSTESFDFPVVTNRAAGARRVIQKASGGFRDGFVAKLGQAGTNLVYSTYLGGASQDSVQGIGVDAAGLAYVTGYTMSTNFPVVPAKSVYLNRTKLATGLSDAFLTVLSADGATNLFSNFLGGSGTDVGLGLAVQGGAAYLAGYTYSSDFPVSGTVANSREGGTNLSSDVFVAKYSPTNWVSSTNSISVTNQSYFREYSVKFGGDGKDQAFSLAVDAAGEACVVGYTHDTNFFGTNAFVDFRSTNTVVSTRAKAFVTLLSADASSFQYAALLGGSRSDTARAVALDAAGNAYIVGSTTSGDFPTVNSIKPRPGGKQASNDVFVAKIFVGGLGPAQHRGSLTGAAAEPVLAPSPLSILPAGDSVTLSWPAYLPELKLQTSPNPSAGIWQPVGLPISGRSNLWNVTVPATNSEGFFRLTNP